jgi:polyhydroxybutyrate depolymerase
MRPLAYARSGLLAIVFAAGLSNAACMPPATTPSPGRGGNGGTSATGNGGTGSGNGGAGGGIVAGAGGAVSSTGGTSGAAGSGGASTAGGAGGTSMSTNTGGSTGADGAVATDAAASDVGADGAAAGPGWGGVPGVRDFSPVDPSMGCGSEPGQALGSWVLSRVTMMPRPIRGSGTREYYIKLPTNYDNKKPYRLIFVAPGCTGKGNNMFDFTSAAGTEGVVQVGLNPEPGVWMQECFDDKKTDSIEYQFLETVLDIARKKLCIDQNRVFITGHSSGGWLSNQMGCTYGSKLIRAIAPSSGGLAIGDGIAPRCTELPTPGIWSNNENDNPGANERAMGRALKVNGCKGTFADSPRAPWMGEQFCEQFTTCPPQFPIVYCHPPTGGHLGNLGVQPARSWKFFKSLP